MPITIPDISEIIRIILDVFMDILSTQFQNSHQRYILMEQLPLSQLTTDIRTLDEEFLHADNVFARISACFSIGLHIVILYSSLLFCLSVFHI